MLLPPVIRSHGAVAGSTGIETALGGLLAATLALFGVLAGAKALTGGARATRRAVVAWLRGAMFACIKNKRLKVKVAGEKCQQATMQQAADKIMRRRAESEPNVLETSARKYM